MSEFTNNSQSSARHKLILFIGIVGLMVLIVFGGVVAMVFTPTAQLTTNQGNTVTTNQAGGITSDPLVTVVPEAARQGSPQPLVTDPKRGVANPTVTIIEFGDFECEACGQMHPILEDLLNEFPDDLLYVWKDMPVPTKHKYSEIAALAGRCAQDENKFWQYHDQLFDQQKLFPLNPWSDIAVSIGLNEEVFNSCLENKLHRDLVIQGYFIGRTLGIDRTPSFFINDQLVLGSASFDQLKKIIEDEIDKTKQES